MRECRGGLRYVCNGAIGILTIHVSLLVRPELGEQLNEARREISHETTLEVVVSGINGRRIKPSLYDLVSVLSDRVVDRLAKALQRFKYLAGTLGISSVEDVDLCARCLVLVPVETQIYAELPWCLRNELNIKLYRILDLTGWKVHGPGNYVGIDRMETIF